MNTAPAKVRSTLASDPQTLLGHLHNIDGHEAATDLRGILAVYQSTIRSIVSRRNFPGVSLERLEQFKQQHRTSAFTCRLGACARATVGFENDKLRVEHERSHVQRFICELPGCQYPPFPSARALKSHINNNHDDASRRRPIGKIRPQNNTGIGNSSQSPTHVSAADTP